MNWKRFSRIGLIVLAAVCANGAVIAQEQNTPSEERPKVKSATPDDTETAERQRQLRRMRMISSAELTVDGATISLLTGRLPVDGPDYASVDSLKPGEVLLLTRSQTIKLKSDRTLVFGDVELKTENFAKDYPGVYGLWLKRTEDGWSFVFNSKPDVWGTMYDPTVDVGEVAVNYGKAEKPTEELAFKLQSGTPGALHIVWGDHHWWVPFTTAD